MFYENLQIDMPWNLSCCSLFFTIFGLGKKKFSLFSISQCWQVWS